MKQNQEEQLLDLGNTDLISLLNKIFEINDTHIGFRAMIFDLIRQNQELLRNRGMGRV